MISVIFPVYNEQDNLQSLYERVVGTVSQLKQHTFEFIFVDDCSSDHSPVILKGLSAKDPRVKMIRFARNCGSHAALKAGLNYCQGNSAIILASDLQDPPEVLIPKLLEAWGNGSKIVWGVRSRRDGESTQTKFFSGLYYSLMNWLTTVKMPPSGADVFLADRVVITAFKRMSEKHTSVFMGLAWLGFPQSSIYYVKESRYKGSTKWTLGRKIKLTLDSLLSFSDVPVRYMSVIGFLTALFGFAYAGIALWKYFMHETPVSGWSSVVVAVLIVGGVQMTMLGVLGEYIWRTFDESRRRPQYVIEYIEDKHASKESLERLSG